MTPEELEFLQRAVAANEEAVFEAKLADLGGDNCAVCRANRVRDAWTDQAIEDVSA